jgi:hypothetical protein
MKRVVPLRSGRSEEGRPQCVIDALQTRRSRREAHCNHRAFTRVLALCALIAPGARVHAEADPLPSWNDRAAKQAIVAFVRETNVRVTR